MQWAFPVAVTLHSTEEALFLPKWVERHRDRLPVQPEPHVILSGLLLLTFAACVVTYLSGRNGKQSVWTYLFFGFASAMLLNVFLPHIPATLSFHAYTPGVLTAVLINLPCMSFLLFHAVSERWVSGIRAVAYAALVPIAIAGAIAAVFLLSSFS